MNATVHGSLHRPVHSGFSVRGMIGLGLLVLAPLQFWAGHLLLSANPLQRALSVAGLIGFVLVFSSSLVFTVGLGEAGNWLVHTLRKE